MDFYTGIRLTQDPQSVVNSNDNEARMWGQDGSIVGVPRTPLVALTMHED